MSAGVPAECRTETGRSPKGAIFIGSQCQAVLSELRALEDPPTHCQGFAIGIPKRTNGLRVCGQNVLTLV